MLVTMTSVPLLVPTVDEVALIFVELILAEVNPVDKFNVPLEILVTMISVPR